MIPTVECFLCQRQIKFGHGVYEGRVVRAWGITICRTCESGNWDGIVPRVHPRLVEHLSPMGSRFI